MRIKTRKMVTCLIVVIVALIFLVNISIATDKPMFPSRVLDHDVIEIQSPKPLLLTSSAPAPFEKEIYQEIDTTPALARLLEGAWIYSRISNLTKEDIGFEVTTSDDVGIPMDYIGKPLVPFIVKKFKIPVDSHVESVIVNLSDSIEIDHIFIEPAPKPPHAEYAIDEEIYSSSEPYPGKEYEYREGTGIDPATDSQVKYIIIRVYPIQYFPLENKVIAFRNATISLSITPPPSQPSALAPRQLGAGEEYECVIITHPDFVDECQQLADWKSNTEISTNVVDTMWINNNYEGFDGIHNDLPSKIKNYVNDSVTNWGKIYIILAGDIDKVPTRYVYVNDSSPHDPIDGDYVPSDLYFVDLCDWDPNNDGYYGAKDVTGVIPMDVIDMIPNAYIGRLPASTEAELNNLGPVTIWGTKNLTEQSGNTGEDQKCTPVPFPDYH